MRNIRTSNVTSSVADEPQRIRRNRSIKFTGPFRLVFAPQIHFDVRCTSSFSRTLVTDYVNLVNRRLSHNFNVNSRYNISVIYVPKLL